MARVTRLLSLVDLLAINMDEAAASVGIEAGGASPETIVSAAVEKLSATHPGLSISITAGRNGSWSWDGNLLAHAPSFSVEAVSTAGAGDAHLAGTVAGLVAGLNLHQAQELGNLVAAVSVTSPHTIHPEIERALHSYVADALICSSPEVLNLLGF